MFKGKIITSALAITTIATGTLTSFPGASWAIDPPSTLASTEGHASRSEAQTLLAQAIPSRTTRDINVTGTSQATAPADRATILLTYYLNYMPDYSDDSDDSESEVSPLPPAPTASDWQPIVAALTGAGVPAANVKVYPDPSSSGTVKVRVTLDQPTQERVEQLMNAATTAATQDNRFAPSGASVGYAIRDCQAIENRARQAAMVDARNRATALASVAGVQVGEILSISESVIWGNYVTSCPSIDNPTPFPDPYAMPPFDPTQPAVVTVSSQLSVTYQMRD